MTDVGLRRDVLEDRVLVQVGARGRADLGQLGAAAGGVVLTGSPSAMVSAGLRRSGVTVLIDPARYLTDREQPARLVDETEYWLELQADQQTVAYLSPAGFVGRDDRARLDEVVELGDRFLRLAATGRHAVAPCYATVAVDSSWVSARAAELVASVAGLGRVALTVAHAGDPFATRQAVRGLARLAREVPRLLLLRTDLAGLGALAHGAGAAAIGVSTSTRHFVPPGGSGFANLADPSPRVLVPRLLAYVKASRLERQAGDEALACACQLCRGESVARFADPMFASQADVHSVLAWRQLADDLIAQARSRRPAWWAQRCVSALHEHEALEERGGLPEAPRAYLRWWAELE